VDYVAGTSMALAFCFLGISAMLGLGVAQAIYLGVNATLNLTFGTNSTDAGLIFLWALFSFIATVAILFLPIIPNAHSVLAGNAVKRAKAQHNAFKSGLVMASQTGNVGAVGLAGALGIFSWIGNRLTSSIPAVVVLVPLILQRVLMDNLAQPLVAVQDGGFIGNRGGFGQGAKSVIQNKVNNKIGKHNASNVGVVDGLADSLDPTKDGGLSGVGKNIKKGAGVLTGKNGSKGSDKPKDDLDGVGKGKGRNGSNLPPKPDKKKSDNLVNTNDLIDPKTGKKVDPNDLGRKEEILTDQYIKKGLNWANAKNQAKKDIANEQKRNEFFKNEKELTNARELEAEKTRIAKATGTHIGDISDDIAGAVIVNKANRASRKQERSDLKNLKKEAKSVPISNIQKNREAQKAVREMRAKMSKDNLGIRDKMAKSIDSNLEYAKRKLDPRDRIQERLKIKETKQAYEEELKNKE
jgi:hypothetical protein